MGERKRRHVARRWQAELPFSPSSGELDRLREEWRVLVEEELPAAAERYRWSVRHDHCFGRILLDYACGLPWREVIAPPAWRNAPKDVLECAINAGKGLLLGDLNLTILQRHSLALRRQYRRT